MPQDISQRTSVQMIYLFEQLTALHLSHIYMKITNIILHSKQPALLDLGGMHEHNSDASLKKETNKDSQRFHANLEGSEKILGLFRLNLDITIRELQLAVA